MEWRIGCSGYYYPEWKGVFYPDDLSQKKWLDFYCSRFNTLELNVTYYRFPRLDTLRTWKAQSPADFRFTLKAPRYITHFRKFTQAQKMLADFYQVAVDGLGEKLGCVLFQFPASFQYEADRLARITEMLDPSVQNVLEYRHVSWWRPEVMDLLAQLGVAFCGMSHPELPDRVIATTDIVYYRFHGVPFLYNSRYDTGKLEDIVREIEKAGGQKAFIYFNNTAQGHAVVNARELQEAVAGHTQSPVRAHR